MCSNGQGGLSLRSRWTPRTGGLRTLIRVNLGTCPSLELESTMAARGHQAFTSKEGRVLWSAVVLQDYRGWYGCWSTELLSKVVVATATCRSDCGTRVLRAGAIAATGAGRAARKSYTPSLPATANPKWLYMCRKGKMPDFQPPGRTSSATESSAGRSWLGERLQPSHTRNDVCCCSAVRLFWLVCILEHGALQKLWWRRPNTAVPPTWPV